MARKTQTKSPKIKGKGKENGEIRAEKAAGEGLRNEEKQRQEEVAVAEIRTTQATYQQDPPEPYTYRDGCPDCGAFPVVTEQKIRTYRVCRCRECGWRGEMVG
ncbi:MAG: hypothetical protein A4E65_02302 [Syntrophorhabdus sp. PtaU1.Bin153]|nr:MAG: hypothetical protein A4E65_02302 [Syntrophorhabdus sp. PtaU1.Bin153]